MLEAPPRQSTSVGPSGVSSLSSSFFPRRARIPSPPTRVASLDALCFCPMLPFDDEPDNDDFLQALFSPSQGTAGSTLSSRPLQKTHSASLPMFEAPPFPFGDGHDFQRF